MLFFCVGQSNQSTRKKDKTTTHLGPPRKHHAGLPHGQRDARLGVANLQLHFLRGQAHHAPVNEVAVRTTDGDDCRCWGLGVWVGGD